MATTKISDLNAVTEAGSDDYLVIDNGSDTRKIKVPDLIPPSTPFSFVGMVVQGTNLNTQASVKAIYGDDTSWTLLSSVALASENVFGNGKALGITDGTKQVGLYRGTGSQNAQYYGSIGSNVGDGSDGTTLQNVAVMVGIPTKNQISANPNYSGIITDTITVYMWERTA